MSALKLSSYLDQKKLSKRSFAGQLGVAGAVISRYCSGARIPTTRFALAIEKATGGVVPASSWAQEEKRRADQRPRRIHPPHPSNA
jgi:DNA-binding transcriptional regulator YdaS (Cro superfamily)